jgi:hypothetical protein
MDRSEKSRDDTYFFIENVYVRENRGVKTDLCRMVCIEQIDGILEIVLCNAQRNVGAGSGWGRHGFDGIACGREACRGVDTRNRSQNYKCRTSIRACCLIKLIR